jgi:hypothetical protein
MTGEALAIEHKRLLLEKEHLAATTSELRRMGQEALLVFPYPLASLASRPSHLAIGLEPRPLEP